MDNYILIYVGGIVLLYFLFAKFIPFIKKAKKKTKAIFSQVYINNHSTINDEQYRKLAIGALYSEQQTAYINSLTTGLDKNHINTILSQWWGIENSSIAKNKLDYLANKGFNYYFDTILKCFEISNEQQKDTIIQNSFSNNEDIEKAYDQLDNLQDIYDDLIKNNIISSMSDLRNYTNIGWDCGRLVFLSRLCFDAGYLSEQEAWNYINKAYNMAIEKFNNWNEFSKSYIIGRGMWGGNDCGNDGIMMIAEELLINKKSPWVRLSFK